MHFGILRSNNSQTVQSKAFSPYRHKVTHIVNVISRCDNITFAFTCEKL